MMFLCPACGQHEQGFSTTMTVSVNADGEADIETAAAALESADWLGNETLVCTFCHYSGLALQFQQAAEAKAPEDESSSGGGNS